MSATVLPTPTIETRGRLADVIDVDLLEDDEIQFVSSSSTRRPRSRSNDVIDVDNLPEAVAGPSSAHFFPFDSQVPPLTRYFRTDLSRYRSPPLRQRSRPSPIPPVPPLPSRFRRHRPTFRHPPHQIPTLPSGIVLANPQPLAFEERLLGQSRHHTPTNEDTSEPSAPSHHIPVMGFGGALIASNNELQANHPPHRHQRRATRAVRLLSNSLFSPIPGITEDNRDYFFGDGLDATPTFADFFPPFFSAYNRLGRFSEAAPPMLKNAPEYKRTFTHPPKVAPGFTHDFASSGDVEDLSVAGASSGPPPPAVDTVLVCAKCLDPLVMGNVPDEKRLWGLRCGHTLDGKCIRELMRPADAQEVDDKPPTESTGKGKEKAIEEQGQQDYLPDENGGSLFGSTLRRLRSGRVVSTTASRSKGKQKQRAEELKVERVHEWSCPVSGCGRTHKTNLISGSWKPDRSEGAVLMYV